MGEPKETWKLLVVSVEEFPKSEFRPLQLFSLVRAGTELRKNQKDVQTYYDALLTEFPDDRHTAMAKELKQN